MNWRVIGVAAAAAIATATLGASLTELGPWYQNLAKPWWQPPDMAFGPIWTVIFTLTATSGVMAWQRAGTKEVQRAVIGLFAMNAVLNVMWSLLFFKLRRPDHALVEVGLLWLSIAVLMYALIPLSRRASLLLAPYLVWVTIAALLNYEVVRLNPPFG